MIRPLNPREKWLAAIVGAIFLFGGGWWLLESFLTGHAALRSGIEAKAKQLALVRRLTNELAFWEQREQWLQATQPKLANADTAGVELLNHIKDLARKHSLLLENPSIRVPERQPAYTSIAIELETKSGWSPLIAFLGELQNPDQFIALETANLKIDTTDPTQMRGRFKIARWYAPQ